MKHVLCIASLSIAFLGACEQSSRLVGESVPEPAQVCTNTGNDSVDYLTRIGCEADWSLLDGPPMNAAHGRATTTKFVFDLDSGRLWFPNAKLFPLHWDFAVARLGLGPKDYYSFWYHQYYESPKRRYVLGTLNRYEGSNLCTMQLFPGDDLAPERLARVFHVLRDSVWFGRDLKFLPPNEASVSRGAIAGIPMATADEVYKDQTFQGLNTGTAYGTLVRVSSDLVGTALLSPHDIVLTDGIPNDLPVVAGVVTVDFQTPLSHVNVLSRNRGTPNMALRTAWTDSVMGSLVGRLVRLQVDLDGYSIREADPAEARAFWAANGPGEPPDLPLDTTKGLVSLSDLGRGALPRVGAKAANFGELARLAKQTKGDWKVPEGGFAIPFASYLDHMRRNGLDRLVDSFLADSALSSNATLRKGALEALQSKIVAAPVDPSLLAAVAAAIRANGTYTRMRFRSSTNAEDLAAFNGAGLYSSFTGDLDDPKKSIIDAIRKTWASLWEFRAYEERDYYRIDQNRVAMGILVHRSFPDEGANGVAITTNLYDPDYFGYVINAQVGEVSVVDPPAGVVTEQQIFYPFDSTDFNEPSIETITRSSLTAGLPVLSQRETAKLGYALKEVERWFSTLEPSEPDWIRNGLDVEFKIDGATRQLYLKQARPLPVRQTVAK
ncbi:MAG: hypothetical protein RL173_1090 [Fibrobacterota bacterium]|jgi:pyruvate,water dikinase